jgi:hypothetical protein
MQSGYGFAVRNGGHRKIGCRSLIKGSVTEYFDNFCLGEETDVQPPRRELLSSATTSVGLESQADFSQTCGSYVCEPPVDFEGAGWNPEKAPGLEMLRKIWDRAGEAGLKPDIFQLFMARLKSGPDTKQGIFRPLKLFPETTSSSHAG